MEKQEHTINEPDPAPNWAPSVGDIMEQIQEDTDNLTNDMRPTVRYCTTVTDWETRDTTTTDDPNIKRIPIIETISTKHHIKATTRIMQKALEKELPAVVDYRMHLDGGANLSVTPRLDLLVKYKNIKKHAIAGVAQDGPALYATGVGYLPWRAEDGTTLLVKCYFSNNAAETIISPTDVVVNKFQDYNAWSQYSNLDTGQGYITFHRRDNENDTVFPLTTTNGLWYYHGVNLTDYQPLSGNQFNNTPCIRSMTRQEEYELYHFRLGCAGDDTMEEIPKHADDCPTLKRNPFRRCKICMQEKCTYRPMPSNYHKQDKKSPPVTNTNMPQDTTAVSTPPIEPVQMLPGQMFQMDFGFVRGKGFSTKDEDGRRITSLDGMNCYLIIVDRATRRTWVFPRKSKDPPIDLVRKFLQQNKCRTSTRLIIRTDQGGELYGSQEFQQMVDQEGYIMEPTATDSSFQNGLAERPNRTLATIMRCLLRNAGLGPEYWSWALVHAAYIKNRLPHRTTNQTPYLAWSGNKPSLKHLRIFGCPVIVRLPGPRPAKLEHHTAHGIFLGYTATDHNVYYQDYKTKRVKIATHVKFDEAGYTLPKASVPPAMQILQDIGQREPTPSDIPGQLPEEILQVQLLSDKAKLPVKATTGAAGFDLFSAEPVSIPPHSRSTVKTDITILPPPGTYGQIMSRSGLALKYQTDAKAGVIDGDYRGNVTILLANSSDTPLQVNVGDRVAQLILYRISTPIVEQIKTLPSTERNAGGFGSTGMTEAVVRQLEEPTTQEHESFPNVIDQPDGKPLSNDAHAAIEVIIQEDGINPCSIWLSNDPMDNRLQIAVDVKGQHPTLGMQLVSTKQGRLQLENIQPSTPAAKIPKWRSTLRWGYLMAIDGQPTHTIQEVEQAVQSAKQRKQFKLQCTFATEKRYGSHPVEGSLNLYFDQINAFSKHAYEADKAFQEEKGIDNKSVWCEYQEDDSDCNLDAIRRMCQREDEQQAKVQNMADQRIYDPADDPELGRFFKKKEILARPDYPEWQQSCFKQLDQYHTQGMFSNPMALPKGCGASYMHWTFLKKMCGTKKAWLVYDGARNRSMTTLGHTYANSVDAPSERLFWALTAKFGLIAIGADVSNAFAEAPPPEAPCYMFIDEFFRDWWENHLHRPPIPQECNVVRIQKAIQGHPESPRLWEKHIDKILREMGFQPTRHEPCLYSGKVNGELVLFLRQVDDFSVSAKDAITCSKIIAHINSKMSMDVKDLGLIGRFNGVDIFQTKYYIKLTCERYLTKMLQSHKWTAQSPPPTHPLPLSSEQEFIRSLETAIAPETVEAKEALQQEMGFKYRQVIGELIWPMVKCRPDVAPYIIRLSQHNENPAKEHYKALRQIADYLAATITEGIYYWRDEPVHSLPEGKLPTLHSDNYKLQTKFDEQGNLLGMADSDWAGDSIKRKSMTGIIIMLAGGAIAYKSKYQEVIALSTTEAEFIAACDAGKMILFFRSILEDLGVPQQTATVLYEDNNGALMMANAQQPTRRTRHMDIKYFSLLDWVERDMTILQGISTHDNAADAMTKFLPQQLFYRHMDTYMGKRIPKHITDRTSSSVQKNPLNPLMDVQNMGGVLARRDYVQ